MNLNDFKKILPSTNSSINILEIADIFLKKQLISFLDDYFKDSYSITKFSLTDTDFNEVLDHFKMSPIFGKKFLIVLTDADLLEKNEIKQLLNIIEKRKKSKNLLFLFFKKIKNKTLIEYAKKENILYSISTPNKTQIKRYISGFFKKNNLKFEDGVEEFIIENIGDDLESIFFELQKILNFHPKNNVITINSLKKIIFSTKEENIFKFIDAFWSKNKNNIFIILDNLLSLNTDVEQILSMLLNSTNTLLMVKSLSEEKKSDFKKIKEELNIHPYSLKKHLQQAKLFSFSYIYNLNRELIKVQYNIRKTGLNKNLIFKHFLIKYLK